MSNSNNSSNSPILINQGANTTKYYKVYVNEDSTITLNNASTQSQYRISVDPFDSIYDRIEWWVYVLFAMVCIMIGISVGYLTPYVISMIHKTIYK